ncbi:MAG: glycerophosphodiester phosphodiesterase family protein [Chitinophagaceae bacterium]
MPAKIILRNSLVLLSFLASCQATNKPMATTSYQPAVFDTQGHRGARGLAPENTWPAMKAGLDAGVRTLEMDVVITRDKKVLVSHDVFFNHEITTRPDGKPVTEGDEKSLNLFGMDYGEIRNYDVGSRTHPRFPDQVHVKVSKPLLADLLDQVQLYMTTSRRPLPFFNIETKSLPATDNINHPQPAEFVELLMAVIREKKLEDRVTIQSFDFRTLQYLHEHYPAIKTAMLIEGDDHRKPAEQLADLGFKPTIYSPEYRLVTPELIRQMHQDGILVIPWTVNDKKHMDELKQMGVDGLISDYPNLF